MEERIRRPGEKTRPHRPGTRKAPPVDERAWDRKLTTGQEPEALDHPGIQQACSHFGYESVLRVNAVRHNYVLVDMLMELEAKLHPAFTKDGLAVLLREYATAEGVIARRDCLVKLAAWAIAGAYELDDEIRTRVGPDTLAAAR
jgi:hypothetical protein